MLAQHASTPQPESPIDEDNLWDPAGDDSSPGGGGDIPVIEIHAPAPVPSDVGDIPAFSTSSLVDLSIEVIPELPPNVSNEELAAAPNPCVVSPIVTVCVRGERPPPPVVEQLPRGPRPWFPQSWCNWAGIFCSDGQDPPDNDRGPNSETSGKTKAELDEICVRNNRVDIDVCKVRYPPKYQYREYKVCEGIANEKMYACFRTADRLTDYGAHPAP
ncbi:hypothetical protein E4L96_05165 [Massilia arenosa]|uniref:Uncharacterized protein n=1 Tax=Zemynaea arenosa TaxID=2561931 RepID=A0A4Y9SPD6_9BURK|nr:hypothetical protein [Massilia arenosa]TFW25470.1 hypothetical protein E4L96_05165 [Massilia arenosa]